MTTDFRALCAELVDIATAHCHPDDDAVGYCAAVLGRARAALAKPEPPVDGEVAELVAKLRETATNLDNDWYHASARIMRSAADLLERLTEPEPEGPAVPAGREPASVIEDPTDQEIEDWADASDDVPGVFLDPDSGRWERCFSSEEFGATARAVLARWGRQPASDAPASCPPGG
jgi:hypothetical protein